MDGSFVLVMSWAALTPFCRDFLLSLYRVPVEGRATLVPGCDLASLDTLDGAPIKAAESPGVHVEPPQSVEEKELLSG